MSEEQVQAQKFVWRDDYALGIPLVDDEHRAFFTIINELDQLNAMGDAEALRLGLARLQDYARIHFKDEEEFLEAVDCPEVERQRQEHAEYVAKVDQLLNQQPPAPGAALEFARGWLVEHILGSDSRYSHWLEANG